MRPSLWFKLMGIFGAIIATGVMVMFFVVDRATATQFRRFVETGDVRQAQNLSTLLADYYARQGDWRDVETLFTTASAFRADTMGGMMMGHGMMGRGANGSETAQEMFDMMRGSGPFVDRAVLVDAGGVVVADSAGLLTGQRHDAGHLAEGVPVVVGQRQVGTVLVGSMVEPALNPLDQDFLRAVKRAVLLSALAVGGVALVLGSVFFFHVTAPVRELTRAAEGLAAGELDQRVAVRSADEIGRLAGAFNTMSDALARTEALRRQMVADVAHELRTPLSLVQGNLEAILDGMYELNRENVAAVHEETLVLTRLVDDLRVLTLAEAGQLNLQQELIEAADLVQRAVERFRVQAGERQVSLDVDLSPGLPLVRGDAQRLDQVLINLLSNALRHTPAGGRVTVAARQVSAGETSLAPSLPRSSTPLLLVSVTDTGQGISPQDLAYIFERFYRADKSRARTSGGSGLGLAIVRQIVEAHGGHVWADSPGPGQGSTFTLALAL